MSILCIAALLIMKRWLHRVLGPIIVAALTILAMRLWDLRNEGIALINPVPSRLPLSGLRHFSGSEIFIAPALGVWY
jgi:sulfate permease, SulP family